MKKLIWIFNRLKSMSFDEVIYRIKKELKNNINRLKYKKKLGINEISNYKVNLEEVDNDLIKIWGDINKIKSNVEEDETFSVFNEKIDICNKINWHKGMYKNWNKTKFSLDFSTKNTDDIGDIRFTWEFNRQQFLPALAFKYRKLKKDKYLELLKLHFNTWVDENPFLKGVNWLSPMEISLRSYQWLIVYYLLKDSNEDEFRIKILKSVINSNKYVVENLSRFSSANNHLIIEAFILSVVGNSVKKVYPNKWFDLGYNILSEEILKQNYMDGINKEHTLHYQAFVVDAFLQYNFMLRKINKKPISEDLIKKSVEFIGALKANKLNFEFGDSDDAKIIKFDFKEKNYYEYILQLASIYYNEEFINVKSIFPEVQFFSSVYSFPRLNKYKYFDYKFYNKSGYFVINDDENNLLLDLADLGFGSIAAHGHSDALSFIYYNRNNPIFVDSGTYIYNISNDKRDYFRSTEVHNTLSYNGINQSEIKGPFLWGKKAKVNIEEFKDESDKISIKANHNGYKPFIHRREFEYIKNNGIIILRDYFQDKAKINFIIDSQAVINIIDDYNVYIMSGDSTIEFKSNEKINILDTYISKRFLIMEKTKKIVIKSNFNDKFIETKIIPK